MSQTLSFTTARLQVNTWQFSIRTEAEGLGSLPAKWPIAQVHAPWPGVFPSEARR